MKVIDLLNKIANGEEVPKKIKYINSIWEYDKETKDYTDGDLWLFYIMNATGLTERKVEIIEGPKEIPEKLEILPDSEHYSNKVLYGKINEILDYLESKGETNE